jgi:hypothetical protein
MDAANLARLRKDGLVQMGPLKLQTHVMRSAETVSTLALWPVMTETLLMVMVAQKLAKWTMALLA